MRFLALPICAIAALACAPAKVAVRPASGEQLDTSRPAQRVAWKEQFTGPLDWVTPTGHGMDVVSSVFLTEQDGAHSFLHAVHDARPKGPSEAPPAIHYGKSFRDAPVALDRIVDLTWRWRVLRHPNVGDGDPWRDVAASVYVVTKAPGVFGGRGFKFGWLAKPGPEGSKQRGLLQVALRTDAASNAWQTESVDLCALHREAFGACEGEHVLYVGVVTDADNTASVSIADYADFSLQVD